MPKPVKVASFWALVLFIVNCSISSLILYSLRMLFIGLLSLVFFFANDSENLSGLGNLLIFPLIVYLIMFVSIPIFHLINIIKLGKQKRPHLAPFYLSYINSLILFIIHNFFHFSILPSINQGTLIISLLGFILNTFGFIATRKTLPILD